MKELRVEQQRAARRDRNLPVVGTGGRDTVGPHVSNNEQLNRERHDENVAYQSWEQVVVTRWDRRSRQAREQYDIECDMKYGSYA